VEVLKEVKQIQDQCKTMVLCLTGCMDGKEVNNHLAELKARESVTEFLLINHPLDCPVCDQENVIYKI
jgi:NADH dehydrogenase/NADH:ubiquinone oxidoreductase subunit G